MTAPAFEEVPMPKPDIRVDAFGEITATEHRLFVMGGFYTADQLRAYGQQCRPAPCLWTPDADGYWKTACGQGHTFTTDGPTENNHRFCCYCGGAITMKEVGDA